jgi:NADP-reducing hydrogenase subunit HndB
MQKKIRSPKDLKNLKEKVASELDIRSGPKSMTITVHMGTCGIAAGAREVLSSLSEELARSGASDVSLRRSGCVGLCDQEPMFTLTDRSGKEYRYGRLDDAKVRDIVEKHVLGGEPVAEYLVRA